MLGFRSFSSARLLSPGAGTRQPHSSPLLRQAWAGMGGGWPFPGPGGIPTACGRACAACRGSCARRSSMENSSSVHTTPSAPAGCPLPPAGCGGPPAPRAWERVRSARVRERGKAAGWEAKQRACVPPRCAQCSRCAHAPQGVLCPCGAWAQWLSPGHKPSLCPPARTPTCHGEQWRLLLLVLVRVVRAADGEQGLRHARGP